MKSMMVKTTLREIKQSFGRFFAIFAIVFLGVTIFAGLKICMNQMLITGDEYYKEHKFFDYRLISTIGFTDEDIEKISKLDGVAFAEGGINTDITAFCESDSEFVFSVYSIPENVNTINLLEGRMPENDSECVVDRRFIGSSAMGKKIELSLTNTDSTMDMFKSKTLEVVGIVDSPLYLNYQRGSTAVGSGTVNGFLYVNRDALDSEYETEVYLKMDTDAFIYTDEYKDYIEENSDILEDKVQDILNDRFASIVDDAQKEIDDGKKELKDKTLDAQSELDDAWAKLQDGENEYNEGLEKIASGEADIVNGLELIESKKKEIEDGAKQISDTRTDLQNKLAQVKNGIAQAEQMAAIYGEEAVAATLAELRANEAMIEAGLGELDKKEAELEAGKAEIARQELSIADAQAELISGREEIESARSELDSGYSEYYDGKRQLAEETQSAEEEIAEAEDKLADLEEPTLFFLDRSVNIGYVCFENDTKIVDGIAAVIPIFFFAVAALVCMTTMTRMVEEQRTQIGVLKALGYKKSTITNKYLFYSGAAAIVGGVAGYFFGTKVFPYVIWIAYGMMYGFAPIKYVFSPLLLVVSVVASALCSMGATFLSCRASLSEVPASLIRPKALKAGRRILLERITFIWKRLKFLRKVSIRNVFRYAKRFVMMVLGIGGCTALLVTGFALNVSIKNVVSDQYEEIATYGITINVAEDIDETAFADMTKDVLEENVFVAEERVDLLFDDKTKSMDITVPRDAELFAEEMFTLRDKETKKALEFPKEGEAIIIQKAAEKLGLTVGDTVVLRNSDYYEGTVKISGICENYLGNFLFLSPETYENCFGKAPTYKAVYGQVKDMPEDELKEKCGELLNNDDISRVVLSNSDKESFQNMMKSLNYVIVLIIVCAAALAFIVLYNLTNINITERIREIATIKVLGFYSLETAQYVFRENMILTAFGSVLGLVLGRLLFSFVLYNVDIDVVNFNDNISVFCYLLSIAVTFVFAMGVNVVMYFKLKKINMAESLKSVE